jgi:hypothetical protein
MRQLKRDTPSSSSAGLGALLCDRMLFGQNHDGAAGVTSEDTGLNVGEEEHSARAVARKQSNQGFSNVQ